MKTRQILGIVLLALVTVTFTSIPCDAVAPGTGKKCYNCDNFTGTWKCKEGDIFGGTECTTDGDSCTVSGACESASGFASYSLSFDGAILMDVAAVHPRAAATLYKLGAYGDCSALADVFWYNDAVTPDKVNMLINEGFMDLEHLGPAVVHHATIEPYGDDEIVIRIVATEPSDLDPSFGELLVYLAPSSDGGPYEPYSWHITE